MVTLTGQLILMMYLQCNGVKTYQIHPTVGGTLVMASWIPNISLTMVTLKKLSATHPQMFSGVTMLSTQLGENLADRVIMLTITDTMDMLKQSSVTRKLLMFNGVTTSLIPPGENLADRVIMLTLTDSMVMSSVTNQLRKPKMFNGVTT